MTTHTQNPVEYMIRRTGLSRAQFAEKHDFGRNFLTRIVQGRSRSITARLSTALWAEWQHRGIDQDDFDEIYGTLDADTAYQRWVTNRRVTNRVKLPETINQHGPATTPFGRLVQAIGSVSKTAQVLVVPDVSVQRYADGRIREMPDVIRVALHEMKYAHTDSLDAAQKRWHRDHG